MQLKQLLTDDDAVSPVIGVILMVAITVILAAVIGAFVLGFDTGDNAAPQATWEVSESAAGNGDSFTDGPDSSDPSISGDVVFTHNGGDAVGDATNTLTVNGPVTSETIGSNNRDFALSSSRLQAGEQLAVELTGASNGDTINIVWSPDGSDDTNIIGEHTLSSQ